MTLQMIPKRWYPDTRCWNLPATSPPCEWPRLDRLSDDRRTCVYRGSPTRSTSAAKRGSDRRPSKAGSTLSSPSASPAPRAPSRAIRTRDPSLRGRCAPARYERALDPVASRCAAIRRASQAPRAGVQPGKGVGVGGHDVRARTHETLRRAPVPRRLDRACLWRHRLAPA